MLIFADDTRIYFDSDNLSTLQEIVNGELKKVRKWLEANILALNISKTNYVIFHSSAKSLNEFIRIKLGSKVINCVQSIKYLVILVDATLSWKPQIMELSKKLARTTGIFYKIRHYVSSDTLKLLYYSLFYSFLSHGIPTWGLTHPTTLDPLFRVQKKVIRAITFSGKFDSSAPLFYSLKILKLPDVHKLKLLCFVFEYRNCFSLKPFDGYFIPLFSIHDHNTCQSFRSDLFVSRINTTQYGKRTARHAGSVLWNDLPMIFEIVLHQLFLKNKS